MNQFRSSFQYNGRINWFPGHMIKTRKLLKDTLKFIDVVIEIRDSRAPLSTENPILNELLMTNNNNRKSRVIVFNKSDLSNLQLQKRITDYFEDTAAQDKRKGAVAPMIAFTQSHANPSSSHPRHPLQLLKKAAEMHLKRYPPPTSYIQSPLQKEINMLVVGLPNVGKSSFINSIRSSSHKSKAAKVGALPGVTRNIRGFRACDSPPAYLVDTPGIMIPGNLEDTEKALTLSLLGSISEKIVPLHVVADFLLYKLNQLNNTKYLTAFELDPKKPTDDINELLNHICIKKKMLLTNNEPDLDQAAKYFITQYRDAKFGCFTLDTIPTIDKQLKNDNNNNNNNSNKNTSDGNDSDNQIK
ncbi:hypothetical protein CYY_010473 [Polysphondylium violaceum]|uniref:G domain-containing protein n=1 Tax=Polysphondylium violaceum TaxID=133409 RepID=A0A8J4UTT5_9MYCE|nr:hypothetical protein CYY_010473 [Polysphondylium violaceum]